MAHNICAGKGEASNQTLDRGLFTLPAHGGTLAERHGALRKRWLLLPPPNPAYRHDLLPLGMTLRRAQQKDEKGGGS